MSAHELLCLNRVTKPQIPLNEFLKFTADLGIKAVEVRNDFTDKGILDGLSDAELKTMLKETGIKVLTINALYPFEDGKSRQTNIAKLKGLIVEAKRVDCPAIVLCPLNDASDPRTPAQRAADLVAALDAYGPLFAEAKMTGLIEPLGFEICALRTKKAALEGIAKCRYPAQYKLLHDTFHHYLSGEKDVFPKETEIVHVSGVLAGKAKKDILDEDRILVDGNDIMDNKGQIDALLKGGCKAAISYEPFSSRIRGLELPQLKTELQTSIKYLLG